MYRLLESDSNEAFTLDESEETVVAGLRENDGENNLTDATEHPREKMTDYGAPNYKPKSVLNPVYIENKRTTDSSGLINNEEVNNNELNSEDFISNVSHDHTKLYRAVGSALLGSVGIGLTLGYSSGAIESIKHDPSMNWTLRTLSWFGSLLTVGAAVGSLIAGALVDKIGRKCEILVGNLLFVAGWLLIIIDKESMVVACIGRCVTGLGVGFISIAGPIYIGEAATADVRGKLGSCFQLSVTIGLTLAYLGGRWLSWRDAALYSMSFNVLCAILVIIFTPISPRWLLIQSERSEARKALAELRNLEANSTLVNDEIEEIEDSLQQASAIGTASPLEICKTKAMRTPFLIIIVVHVGQQMTGINCVIFYAASIFEQAGVSDSNLASILLGVTQIVGTLIATGMMDKFGRRILLLGSCISMVVFLTIFGTYENYVRYGRDPNWMEYLGMASILAYSFAFALGEGPVPWLVIGEIFDVRAKGFCSSVCSTLNWGTSFLLSYFVADMHRVMGQDWTYWFFALATSAIGVFEFFFVPETKGKTLEEIQAKFQ